ncbi:MAG: hypothetical protein CMN87_12385 [Stappia sp.]|uniref:DUF883 family protein n=1 Tax=Stappia sp. TaxID=1870903 RepID=UPI000C52F0C5|nr:DUF883 C-terminal domain-containing protein [Stappia sp.]MAB00160.1 hypothetical protein [Stappia sp.]MBM20799.1 hypothetical protein [Stappia sp.]
MATSTTASSRNGSNRQAGDDAATIEQNIERLRGDIAALAQSVTRYGADKTGEYKDRANKAGKDIAESSQQALDSLSAELTRLEDSLASRVREKPLQSLGIAAGIGVLIALLARR